MSVLQYKGYQGSVSFDDGCLVIQILHIDDFVSAECDSATQAQSTFEDLVDDYLETCRDLGRTPQKPFKGSFNVRLAPALHKQVAMMAAEEGISLNAWVVSAIERKLEESSTTNTALSHVIEEFSTLVNAVRTDSEAWSARSTMVADAPGEVLDHMSRQKLN